MKMYRLIFALFLLVGTGSAVAAVKCGFGICYGFVDGPSENVVEKKTLSLVSQRQDLESTPTEPSLEICSLSYIRFFGRTKLGWTPKFEFDGDSRNEGPNFKLSNVNDANSKLIIQLQVRKDQNSQFETVGFQ